LSLLLQYREKAWFSSSVKSRLQYLGPQPGIPVLDDEHVKGVHLDPLAGPVDAFCLLVLDPEKVGQPLFSLFVALMFCATMYDIYIKSAVFTIFMQRTNLKFWFTTRNPNNIILQKLFRFRIYF